MYEIYLLPGSEDSLSKFLPIDFSSPVSRNGSKFNSLPLLLAIDQKNFLFFFPLTELSRYSGFKSSNLFFPIQLQIFNKMKFGQKWGNCNVNFYISVRFSGGPGQNWRKLDVVSYPKGLVETCWNSIWTQ